MRERKVSKLIVYTLLFAFISVMLVITTACDNSEEQKTEYIETIQTKIDAVLDEYEVTLEKTPDIYVEEDKETKSFRLQKVDMEVDTIFTKEGEVVSQLLYDICAATFGEENNTKVFALPEDTEEFGYDPINDKYINCKLSIKDSTYVFRLVYYEDSNIGPYYGLIGSGSEGCKTVLNSKGKLSEKKYEKLSAKYRKEHPTGHDKWVEEMNEQLDEAESGNPTDYDICYFIYQRYDYYDKGSGGYTGDKYTEQVFEDAANYYDISVDDVRSAWEDPVQNEAARKAYQGTNW